MDRLKKLGIEKYIDIAVFLGLLIIPFVASAFKTEIAGRFMVYIIIALSLDLLWGYAGLMNLGHAIFFGMGAYIMAISLSAQNGVASYQKMNGITEIVGLTKFLNNPNFAFFVAIIFPAAVAAILGYFIFTGRVKGIFFNIITLSFAALFELLVNNKQAVTGGANGIGGIAKIVFFGQQMGIVQLYYIVFAVMLLTYLFLRWVTTSRFGMVIKSIRENEERLKFLGYNPSTFKIVVFAMSAAIAGLAGALYIPMNSFISPEKVGTAFSTSLLVWLAVGGRGNLTGAVVGALLVNIMESTLSNRFGTAWQMVLGIVMIVIILFFPKGIVGSIMDFEYNHKVGKKLSHRKKNSIDLN